MHKFFILLNFITTVWAYEAITILDNQVDYTHPELQDHIYENHSETIDGYDEDHNGYVDDVNGWSFVANSFNEFDFSLYNKFPEIIYDYYKIRAKKSLGTISAQELKWYKQTIKDPEFKKAKEGFTSFIHGTHVACLAVNKSVMPKSIYPKDVKILMLRYLGEAQKGLFKKKEFHPLTKASTSRKIEHIQSYLNHYSNWIIKKMAASIKYTKGKSKIINASWGQSHSSTEKMVANLFKEQFGKKSFYPNEQKAMVKKFMASLINDGKELLSRHEDILFVFSAGNKKIDTDSTLHYPSSIVLDNVISVGASNPKNEKAYFSNFGKKTVTLFAPGLAINSCVPDDRELPINGTSQAAPQVSSVAAKLWLMAKNKGIRLTATEVKSIIVKTSTKSKDLLNYSSSGGVLSPYRAFSYLARYKSAQ